MDNINELIKKILNNDIEISLNETLDSSEDSKNNLDEYLNYEYSDTEIDNTDNDTDKYTGDIYGEILDSPKSNLEDNYLNSDSPLIESPSSAISTKSSYSIKSNLSTKSNYSNKSLDDFIENFRNKKYNKIKNSVVSDIEKEEKYDKNFVKINKIFVALNSLKNKLEKSDNIDEVDNLALKIYKLQEILKDEKNKDLEKIKHDKLIIKKKIIQYKKKLNIIVDEYDIINNIEIFKKNKYKNEFNKKVERLTRDVMKKINSFKK